VPAAESSVCGCDADLAGFSRLLGRYEEADRLLRSTDPLEELAGQGLEMPVELAPSFAWASWKNGVTMRDQACFDASQRCTSLQATLGHRTCPDVGSAERCRTSSAAAGHYRQAAALLGISGAPRSESEC
jgi:hypothetical protein